jgi:phenylacetate-CoA ligase
MYLPPALSRAFHRSDDALRRRGVWKTYELLRESQSWPRARIEAMQTDKARRVASRAAADSPYYRELFRRAGLDPASLGEPDALAALPVLTKDLARRHAAEIRPPQRRGVRLLPNSTGGSTGSNLHFWVDGDCWRWRDAIDLRLWDMIGARPGAPAAYVWGSPMDQKAAGKLRQRVRFLLDNKRMFSAYRIGDDALADLVAHLGRLRPEILFGYASVLDLIATRVAEGRLAWTLPAGLIVVSSAEALFPEQRRNISETLGARVINLYGCREFGLVALECAEGGGMHVMEERVLVEVAPSADGGPGRLLVTDLDNVGFPFFRYEIGDIGAFDPTPCPCGRSLRKLATVEGRAFDVIRGPSGSAVGGTFWSLLLRTAVTGIENWQVVQHAADRLEIRVTPPGVLDPASRGKLRAEIASALGPGLTVEIVEAQNLEPLPSGKHRFVVALDDFASPMGRS